MSQERKTASRIRRKTDKLYYLNDAISFREKIEWYLNGLTSQKRYRSVCGLLSFICYMKNYATIATPLTGLPQGSGRFECLLNTIDTLETFKKELLKSPVLQTSQTILMIFDVKQTLHDKKLGPYYLI